MADGDSIALDDSARWLRAGVLATIPVNATGALVFSPLGTALRGIAGMAPLDPIYAALLGTWILAIGAAFVVAYRAGRVDASLLAVSAAGKLAFVVAMIAAAIQGRGTWLVALGSAPDLALAFVFVAGLTRARG